MLVNHLVLNLNTFDRRGCASDTTFSDAQFAENKFLGPIGAPLDSTGYGTGPETWSELCDDGHTEEGYFDTFSTSPSPLVRPAICFNLWT